MGGVREPPAPARGTCRGGSAARDGVAGPAGRRGRHGPGSVRGGRPPAAEELSAEAIRPSDARESCRPRRTTSTSGSSESAVRKPRRREASGETRAPRKGGVGRVGVSSSPRDSRRPSCSASFLLRPIPSPEHLVADDPPRAVKTFSWSGTATTLPRHAVHAARSPTLSSAPSPARRSGPTRRRRRPDRSR